MPHPRFQAGDGDGRTRGVVVKVARLLTFAVALCVCFYAWGAAAASAATVTAPGIGTTGNTGLDSCITSGLTTINYGGQNGLLACTYYSASPARWVVDNAGSASAWAPATINTACGAANQSTVQQWAGDNDGFDGSGNVPVYLAVGQASLSDGSSVCVYALQSGWVYTTGTGEFDPTADSAASWSVPTPPAPPTTSTVALSADDQARLDNTWQGEWALVGLLLALMVAPMFVRGFRMLQQ